MGSDVRETWLIEESWEEMDPLWRDRLLVILEDLVSLEHLRACQVYTKEGAPLSHLLGVGGDLLSAETEFPLHDATTFASALQRTFALLDEELPTHEIEYRSDGILFIGHAAGIMLAAWFESGCEVGAVEMRFGKRIRHLRSLQRTRDRGALYV